jgi:hypothetical protein
MLLEVEELQGATQVNNNSAEKAFVFLFSVALFYYLILVAEHLLFLFH